MQRVAIDVTNQARDVFTDGRVTVSGAMFGGIAINHTPSSAAAYTSSVIDLGLGLIRWPGGTISENSHVTPNGNLRLGDNSDAPFAYDLTYPDLFHEDLLAENWIGHQRLGLTAALDLAAEKGIPFSLTLPTERYADRPAEAYEVATNFLNRFFTDIIDRTSERPQKVIFDIGNENYNPETYAAVSNELLRAIRDFRASNPDCDFSVALQAMQTGQETTELIQYLRGSRHEPEYEGLLSQVDIVRVHKLNQTLSSIVQIEDGSQAYWAAKRLLDEVESVRTTSPRPDGSNEVDLYVSAWTVTSNDVQPGLTSGLPAASAMLSLFTGFLELGADYASVWGIANTTESSTSLTHMVDLPTATVSSTPASSLFTLMSHSIVGANLLNIPEMDNTRDADFSAYAFTRAGSTTVYIAANDISGRALDVALDIHNAPDISSVEAIRLTASEGLGGVGVTGNASVEVVGDRILLQISTSYEIVQVTINHGRSEDGVPSVHADYIIVSEGPAVVNLLSGNDTAYGGSYDDLLNGGEDDDYIYGNDGNDTLIGGGGDNFVFGGHGNDTFESLHSRSDVTIVREGGGFLISSSSGSDYVQDVEFYDFLGTKIALADLLRVEVPTEGDDVVTGTQIGDRFLLADGADFCEGLGGNDSIYGGNGDDTLYGGVGSDWLVPGRGNNFVFGGQGADFIVYGASEVGITVDLAGGFALHEESFVDRIMGVEHVSGSRYNDLLAGNDSANLLRGHGGRDTFVASHGADTMDGGGGFDRVSYEFAESGVGLSLGDGLGYEGLATGHVLASIEMAIGSAFNDTLEGSAGRDIIGGRDGDDIFYATSGPDTYYGGLGSDTIDYSNALEGARVFLNLGRGDGGSANEHTYKSVENVVGTQFSDRLSGTGASNILFGGAGDDVIYSYGGDDIVWGGSGNDFIRADAGNDTIYGGLGRDTIWAGSGVDSIIFEGRSSEYRITHLSDRCVTVEHLRARSTDTLYNAEILIFSDSDYLI